MKQVKISALGPLRKKVPEEQLFSAEDAAESLGALVERCTGISEKEPRLCYVVNETIQKSDYLPQDGDHIVLLKMGGAG
jgi:molybdopterin converting factor small subunit